MESLNINQLIFTYHSKGKEINNSWNYHMNINNQKPLVIWGKSGAGKSTLFELIVGFLKPDSGFISLNNTIISKLCIAKRNISYLMQEHPIFEHLTVKENILLGNSHINVLELSNITQQLKIYDLLNESVKNISYGQKKRVLLANTLLQKRKILLLDEPFANLDDSSIKSCINLLLSHQRQHKCFILISIHNIQHIKWLNADCLEITKFIT